MRFLDLLRFNPYIDFSHDRGKSCRNDPIHVIQERRQFRKGHHPEVYRRAGVQTQLPHNAYIELQPLAQPGP